MSLLWVYGWPFGCCRPFALIDKCLGQSVTELKTERANQEVLEHNVWFSNICHLQQLQRLLKLPTKWVGDQTFVIEQQILVTKPTLPLKCICICYSDAPVLILRWLLFFTMEHTWIWFHKTRLYKPRVRKMVSVWYIGSLLLGFLLLCSPGTTVASAACSFLCFWPFCFLLTAARGQHLPLLRSQGSWSAGRWLFPAFRPHSCEGKGDNLSLLVEGGKVLLNLATAALRSARTKTTTVRQKAASLSVSTAFVATLLF